MFNYIRTLVSGRKTRFKDEELGLELDLAYVTDKLIVMGFPAEGLQGLYRNKREHAKTFLDHRHRDNYWIYNLCPLSENSYDAASFDGRVSRYPFPDHHAPPLAMLALASREIHIWLDGSPERVAVLHCKAGKGRSGTIACAYLLSLDNSIRPPYQRSYAAKQWSKSRTEAWKDGLETDRDSEQRGHNPHLNNIAVLGVLGTECLTTPGGNVLSDHTRLRLENVLALHSERRMKAPSPSSSKAHFKNTKPAVSIPSQRRFLTYWSQLIAGASPPSFWPILPIPAPEQPKVRVGQIIVRLRDRRGTRINIVNSVSTHVAKGTERRRNSYRRAKQEADVWVSFARYDDGLVEKLEDLERHTREADGHLGRSRNDIKRYDEGVASVFADGKWDKGKMVRRFAQLEHIGEEISVVEDVKGKVHTYVLKQAQGEIQEDGIILDAAREVQIKLYTGKISIGWAWFIPLFHITNAKSTHLCLLRKDVDSARGWRRVLVDLNIEMEWVTGPRGTRHQNYA